MAERNNSNNSTREPKNKGIVVDDNRTLYRDSQAVSSSMAAQGNIMGSPDQFMQTQLPNPTFNYMGSMPSMTSMPSYSAYASSAIVLRDEALTQQPKPREEEIESGSGSGQVEGGSGEEHETEGRKRKRYHRHTAHQIQEMEAVFKECPHPDDKQRKRLSTDLGLKPRQVKFWFQNRRTQMKAQSDRNENVHLKTENDQLRVENFKLQTALRNLTCPNCGSPATVGQIGEMSFAEQNLRIENARLKEEIARFSGRYIGGPMQATPPPPPTPPPHSSMLLPNLDLDMSMYSRHFQEPMGGCHEMMPLPTVPEINVNLILEQEKPLAMELALSAMRELVNMCKLQEPLWVRSPNGGRDMLNLEEHAKLFPWPLSIKQQQGDFRREATRGTAHVIMNSNMLVEAFLDANKWMELFPSVVSSAKTIQILSSGLANGALMLMHAEFQALSPLIPTREAYFLRYCEHNVQEDTWQIVDFPLDSIHERHQNSLPSCYRRPSGCIIQDVPNGYSKVTWVEHADVEDKPIHLLFNNFVTTGKAFGAHRWLAVLQQQSERLASLMATNVPDLGVIGSPEARRYLMGFAYKMIRSFCSHIIASGNQTWSPLSNLVEDSVRVSTRTEQGGVIIVAVSTTWLPFPHQRVFDLLKDERRRSQLDVVSNGPSSEEVAHIASGSHAGNCISLLRLNASSNSSNSVELMLQESSVDQSGSLIVFSSLDINALQSAMNGRDVTSSLLPLGFVITPVGHRNYTEDLSCLLTVVLQEQPSANPADKLNPSNVESIHTRICNLVHQLSVTLRSNIGTSFSGSVHAGPSSSGEGGSGARLNEPPSYVPDQ